MTRMTFDEWLDEPQTVSTRRDRLTHFTFSQLEATPHQAEMLLAWIAASWNAGADNRLRIVRDDDTGTPHVLPLRLVKRKEQSDGR